VIIEAWNDDFDCSKLVQYRESNIIHTLSCNGTNNGTNNATDNTKNNGTDSSSHNPSTGLSKGAWAGLGVAIGLVVIGLVCGLLWLYVHFKSQLRKLMEAKPQELNKQEVTENYEEPIRTIETQEVDGTGIIREKPDDSLIVELPVRPAELPTSP
jgi:hypothetical protein